ncbi:MAG: DUF2723 domain-containing protein [Bacteroidota bacterium]
MTYKKWNNIIGWLVFAIATAVYLLTIEPTASWWDCGEFIATSFKLQIGHPPGAPLFMMMGRLFTLFAGNDLTKVAMMVNVMSALASSFSILFLFWSITMLAKKMYSKENVLSATQQIIIFGSAAVGALAYTFSDSFWFSAVEGEVYASSALFTAFVFWAILKWEMVADQKYADKWIVLIAYMMGLSIGVHLLNLLVIPAIAFIYYFKRYKPTTKGIVITSILSVVILGTIQYGIVAGMVKIASKFELLFVNSFGMPFHSGLMFFILFIIAIIAFGLYWTRKNNKYFANLIFLCFTFIFLGYASFAMILIRSNENTPLDENNPDDVFALLSYINREQYGDRPLIYGQCYNAELKEIVEGDPIYKRIDGKYKQVDYKRSYKFDDANCMLFPRMHSSEPQHITAYKNWTDCKDGVKPTFGQNLQFLFSYQINWMYFRYFMWNFAGKQNDVQGHGNIYEGNWISGIKFIDEMRLGSQDNLPNSLKDNKGRNVFYMLPLILGILGMIFHYKKNKNDAWVVMILFFMTGLAIIIYLNQTPYQPRERDYAYAGSFYAFAIWIGLGVAAIVEYISKLLKKNPSAVTAVAVTAACLVLVPGIMAKEGWDDHDRSGKTSARDFAYNYLMSCAPNAVLFTNGDNDTFPLWYLQEVENVRTDVRVANYTLLGGDWHIHQMFLKAYNSNPLPLTLKKEDYNQGSNDYLRFYDRGIKENIELKNVIDFVANPSDKAKLPTQDGTMVHYLPTSFFKITLDSARLVNNKTVDLKRYRPLKELTWELKKGALYKHEFMLYDFIGTNNFKRPVYFASSQSVEDILPLGGSFKLEGFASRLIPAVPIKQKIADNVNTDVMYENMVNVFRWGNLNKVGVYVDPESFRMAMMTRSVFARLANALIYEGKYKKAIKAIDKCMEVFPPKLIPLDMYSLPLAEAYYRCGESKKANDMVNELANIAKTELEFCLPSLKTKYRNDAYSRVEENMAILQNITEITKNNNQPELNKRYTQMFNEFAGMIQQ